MDVGIVAASFLLTYFAARRLGVPGPGSWAVLCTLAVASWRLYLVGDRWHDLGLRMPDSAWRVFGWVIALYAVAGLVKVLVIDPLAKVAGWPALNLTRFSKLPGNSQVGRDLGLKGNIVSRWVRESTADPTHSFPGKGIMKPEDAELDRLRKEIVKLKAERDLLKKATAYFAREST